jgi:hypothetical protein
MDESSTLAGGESWVRVAAAVAAATLLLASIAAYNGFPLVGGDTGVILRVGNHLHVPTERSFAYAIYLRVLREIGGPWLVVLVDSLLAAMILYLTVRVLMERRSIGVYLTIIVGLVLLSSLPWFTGRLLPDVFSGILVLSMFLLGFGRHRLGRGATAFVVLVASCAIGFHLSHVPLSIGLFLVVLLLSFLLARARLLGSSPVYFPRPYSWVSWPFSSRMSWCTTRLPWRPAAPSTYLPGSSATVPHATISGRFARAARIWCVPIWAGWAPIGIFCTWSLFPSYASWTNWTA